jgi:hypothetical protein
MVKSRHCIYRIRPSEINLLNIFSAFAGCTRAPWTIEHGCAGGTELLFVVGKAKGQTDNRQPPPRLTSGIALAQFFDARSATSIFDLSSSSQH